MSTATKKRFVAISGTSAKLKTLLATAKEQLEQIGQLEASALDNARNCGRTLNKLKRAIKQNEGDWLTWVEEQLNISERTAAVYMRIASRWKEIEPLREKNPHLSINAADLSLRKVGHRRKPEPAEPADVTEARATAKKVIADLSPEGAVYFALHAQVILKQIEADARRKLPAQRARIANAAEQAKAVA